MLSLSYQETEEPPPIPEPLMWLRRLRNLGMQLYAGGYMDQPAVFLREIEAANEAELEYKAVQQRNLELKLASQEREQATNAQDA